jgi:hypothetical protein
MKKVLSLGLCAFSLSTLSAACGDDTGPASGSGAVTFTSWGEEYIEVEIPAGQFEDGYSVAYDKFLVLIGNITVADDAGEVAATDDRFFLVNHKEAGVKELVKYEGLAAGSYSLVSYQTSPASRDAISPIGSVSEADADMMAEMGFHVYVEGTLTGPSGSKTFQWGFGVPTLLDDCEGERDGTVTPGAVVTEGGDDVIELTIHGDHLFYDDLQAKNAVLRGQAMFDADADADGVITREELKMVQLVSLPADEYGTGGVDGVNDLDAFVQFLSRTVGHFRGEGECFLTDPAR